MESKELAMQIAKLLDSKKATRVKVLKVRDLTVLADYFVIASGTSSTHVKSLAEEVEFQFNKKKSECVYKITSSSSSRKRVSRPSVQRASTPRTGLSWIMPTSSSMCSAPTRGTITIWTICGPTAKTCPWISSRNKAARRPESANLFWM